MARQILAFQWEFQDRYEWPDWASESELLEEVGASLIGAAVVGLRVYSRGAWTRVNQGDWIVLLPDDVIEVVSDAVMSHVWTQA